MSALDVPIYAPADIYLPLFARSTLAIIHLWPALRIAVSENWGGPESAEKRTWLVSVIVDEYEARPPLASSTGGLDLEDTEEMVAQAFEDEFGSVIEDGSPRGIAVDLRKAWEDAIMGREEETRRLEAIWDERKGKSVQGTRAKDEEILGERPADYDSDEDDEEEAPQLVDSQAQEARPPKEKQEKVVDEDGFELVQKKGSRR